MKLYENLKKGIRNMRLMGYLVDLNNSFCIYIYILNMKFIF